ncbi:MAG: TadE family type IV pilus minor pilin [Bifidobacterium psychraerophilum]
MSGIKRFFSGSDPGTVTAEFAMILPAVMALAMLLLGLTEAVRKSLDCQDAASVAAREIFISGDDARAVAAARVAAGERTVVQLQHSEDHVVVTTQCPIAAEVFGALPFAVTGKATGFLNE